VAIREILLYADNEKSLRKKSKPIMGMDRGVIRIIRDLNDTLNAHSDGIGLAAPQINVHQRIVLVRLRAMGDESDEPGPPIALVNPKIIEAGDECKNFDGCLSFPGLYGETYRPHHIRVIGLDEKGHHFDQVFYGSDAVVVHHEIDHLDGKLFIDHINNLEDLYTLQKGENGDLVRVPVTVNDF
jgi:peptide deformylase